MKGHTLISTPESQQRLADFVRPRSVTDADITRWTSMSRGLTDENWTVNDDAPAQVVGESGVICNVVTQAHKAERDAAFISMARRALPATLNALLAERTLTALAVDHAREAI